MINYDKSFIITVGKVGSSTIYHSLCKSKKVSHHGHSLGWFKDIMQNKKNVLFIVGVRNPIKRNLSYFFQTYKNDYFNEIKTKKNNYKGEYCYIEKLIDNQDVSLFVEEFKNFKYHFTFNDWFYEFFELNNIKDFDKDKGYSIYDLDNNNKLLVYTLEKLDSNKDDLCKLLDIKKLTDYNTASQKGYKSLYDKVRDKVNYTPEHIDKLLNTDIMRFFYNQDTINNFKLDANKKKNIS